MKSVLFFDCETSGLDSKRHSIVQIAWIIVKGGIESVRRVFDVKPDDDSDINLKALEVNGFTFDRLMSGSDIRVVTNYLFNDIKEIIGGGDAMIPAGHNVRFDLDFLNMAFQKNGLKYTLHYGNTSILKMNRPVCTLMLCHYLDYLGVLKLPEYKLSTVCKHFGIPIEAHDAMADIQATRLLLVHLEDVLAEHYAKV